MATFTWNGRADGTSFEDAGNWSPGGGPPGAGDVAQITSAPTITGAGDVAELDLLNGSGTVVLDTSILTAGSVFVGGSTEIDGAVTCTATFEIFGSLDVNAGHVDVTGDPSANDGVYQYGADATIENAGTVAADWYIVGYYSNFNVALDVTGAGSLLSIPNAAVNLGGGVQGGLSLNTPGASVNVTNGGSIDTTVIVMGAPGDKLVVDDASVTVTQTSTDPVNGVAGVYLAGGTLAVQDGATFSTTFLLESGDTASQLVVDAATLDSTSAGPDAFNGLRLVDGANSFQNGATVDVTELYFGTNGDGSTPTLDVLDSTLTATGTVDNGGFSFDGIWLAGGDTTISGSQVDAHALQIDSPPGDGSAPASTVMIDNGATVSADTDVRIGFSDRSAVAVAVSGAPASGMESLLLFGGTLYVADGPGDGGGGATVLLEVSDGGRVSATADAASPDGTLVVGESAGDLGSVVITGVAAAGDASLVSVNDAVVGELGDGEVQVAQGGSWSVDGALVLGDLTGTGELTLSDTVAGGEATADTLVVGNYGTGDVALTDMGATAGGTLTVNGDATIGLEAGSQGTVSGTDADWAVGGTLTVGAAGTADVGLDGGSLTVVGDLVLGQDAIAGLAADTYGVNMVLGDVALTLGGSLTVGKAGDASLIFGSSAEQVTEITDVTIAADAGSNSALTVENPTTGLSVGTLIVGDAGQGAFDVLDGAVVQVTGDAAIGLSAATDVESVVTVSVGADPLTGEAFTSAGATLDVAGQLTVGAEGAGALMVGDDKGGAGAVGVGGDLVLGASAGALGTVVVQNTYTDAAHATFTSELVVDGDIYVGADATGVESAGTLDPGGVLGIANHGSVFADAAGHGIVDVGQSAGSTGGVALETGGFLSANEIDLGDAGQGELSSTSSDVTVDGDLNIGVQKTGLGTATVDGAASLLSFSGAIAVGLAATGTVTAGTLDAGGVLSVTGGGQVQSEGTADGGVDVAVDIGSTGSVDVDAGTMLVNGVTIGVAGAGTLMVADSGYVESAGAFDVGETAGASGTVTIASGTLSADGLAVGVAGTGAFTLDAGKVDVTTGLDVGSDKTAVGTLAVAGGTLTSADLVVGAAGAGTLTVTTGGQVLIEGTDTSDVILGMDMGATGAGTLDGAGSALVVQGGLVVGDAGTGSLVLSAGATAGAVTGGTLDVEIGQSAGGAGSVTAESAAVLTTNDVVVGDSGMGTLTILNGGTVATAGSAVIGQSETGVGAVTVAGIGLADAGQSLWSLAGDLTVGDLGKGSFTVQSGAVETVAGDVDLGGQAAVLGGTGKGTLSVQGLGVATTFEAKAGFVVGDSGSGEVDVSSLGLVHADADVTLGSEVNASGKLVISFATFLQDGDKASATFGDQGSAKVTVNQGGVLSAGGVAVTLGAGSSGTGALVLNADTIGNVATADTGALTIGDFGAGTVTVNGGGTLTTDGDAVLANTKGGSGTVTLSGRNVDPAKGGGSSWTVSGTVDVGGSGDPATGIAGGTGKIAVTGGAAAHFMGGLVLWAGGTVADSTSPGLIEVGGTAAADTLTGVLVDSGGTIQGAGSIQAAVQDDGEIVAAGGTLAISGDVTGSGTLTLDAGSTLSLAGAVAATDAISLVGDPTLILGAAKGVLGTIEGFGAGDVIDLTGVAYAGTTIGYGGGVLTVVNGGTQATLSFAGSLGLGNFQLGKDAAGKAELSYVVCFAEGTRIAAPGGREVAVEALRPGRRVSTADGGARNVRWVGRRRIDLARHPDPAAAAPVRIRAGAVADGVPARDLLVSPDHAVRVDGALIPARLLLNGASVVQELERKSVVYWHVELDRHDLLLAEGMAAESYLDTGNRGWFEGGPAPSAPHPDFAPVADRPGACAMLTLAEADVLPVWRRLARRAGASYVIAEGRAPEPTLLLDGRVLSPVWRKPGACAFAMPHAAEVRLRSAASRPSDRRPWLDDRRRLGLRVTGIRLTSGLETRELALDDPALSSGWQDVERDAARMWRWTDGDAALPVTCEGPALLELRWIEAGARTDGMRRRAA